MRKPLSLPCNSDCTCNLISIPPTQTGARKNCQQLHFASQLSLKHCKQQTAKNITCCAANDLPQAADNPQDTAIHNTVRAYVPALRSKCIMHTAAAALPQAADNPKDTALAHTVEFHALHVYPPLIYAPLGPCISASSSMNKTPPLWRTP